MRTTYAVAIGSIFTLAFLAHCDVKKAHADGSPDAGPGADQSGSRLRAKVFKGTDGSQQFLNLYDTQLQTDCAYTMLSDATLRCVPLQSVVQEEFEETTYSDAACTMPIYRPPSGNPGCAVTIPTYLSIPTSTPTDGGCSSTGYTTYYLLSQTSTTIQSFYIVDGNGSCSSNTCPASGCVVYPVVRAMAPSEFVQGTVTVE